MECYLVHSCNFAMPLRVRDFVSLEEHLDATREGAGNQFNSLLFHVPLSA